jgi:hypothetical protein
LIFLFQRIGGKSREQRAAARQNAQRRTQEGAAQHGGRMFLKSSLVGNRPETLAVNTSRSCSGCARLLMISP